jgi:hypothetical protein
MNLQGYFSWPMFRLVRVGIMNGLAEHSAVGDLQENNLGVMKRV